MPFPLFSRLVLLVAFVSIAASCSSAPVHTEIITPSSTYQPPSLGPTGSPTLPRPTGTPTVSLPTLVPIPSETAHDHVQGPSDAPVTMIVYSDLQCPFCAAFVPVLNELIEIHGDDLRIIFRHFPLLPTHDKASLAGQAVEAASLQGRFWDMHDYLFETQSEWVDLDPDAFERWLIETADQVGLDPTALAGALQSGRFENQMIESYQAGIRSGLHGTPTLFLNGEPFRLSPEIENLEPAIRLELLAANQLKAPEMTIDTSKQYWAELELPEGTVTIKLDPLSAPESVNSFVYLAQNGWFDNNPFYRVLEGVLVETGDPSGTGFGTPGYTTKDEVDPNMLFDRPGKVALSSAGPGTNGGRFFITLAPVPSLDGTRTIIGDVTEGLDLLERLPEREPLDDLLTPTEGIIQQVTIRIK